MVAWTRVVAAAGTVRSEGGEGSILNIFWDFLMTQMWGEKRRVKSAVAPKLLFEETEGWRYSENYAKSMLEIPSLLDDMKELFC